MTPEAAATNSQPAKPAAPASRPVAATKRVEKYPCKFHFSISIEMSNSLQRLTRGPAGLLREVDIGRLALHSYLMSNDPLYLKAMRGNSTNA
jgi:hypothetical protein